MTATGRGLLRPVAIDRLSKRITAGLASDTLKQATVQTRYRVLLLFDGAGELVQWYRRDNEATA